MTKKISKERAKTILAGGSEPAFADITFASNEESTNFLEKSMGWYRQNFQQSIAKDWVVTYLNKNGKSDQAKRCGGISKSMLKFIAPYCRMHSRGFPMTDAIVEFIEKNLQELLIGAKLDSVPKVSVQDRICTKTHEMLCGLEPVIDNNLESIIQGNKKSNEILQWIDRSDLNAIMASVVRERLNRTLVDLVAAYNKTDMDLVEGYSFIKRPTMKNIIDALESAVNILNTKITTIKANRKPRKKKIKSPLLQVKGLKYLNKSIEYGIDSVQPCGIIGSQGVIVFNTKNKKATVFVSSEPKTGLSIKGSTIIGFDDVKSFEKSVRKPDDFVKNARGCRKTFNEAIKYLNGVKTKSCLPTGRVNKHCMILQVQQ